MSPVNVGLVGLGTMGRNHLRILSDMDEAYLWGAVDTDPGAQARASKDYEGLAIYESLEDMLDAVDLDAVVIAAPTSAHYELAETALKAGLHVFVEKPLASRFWEASHLVALADLRPAQAFMVGYIERFNPAVRKLREFLEQSLLLPRLIEARRSGLVGYATAGTAMGELGSHDIDVISYLLNEAGPEVVHGRGSSEHFIGLLAYHDGLVASLMVDRLSPDKVRKMRVVCDEGTFYLDYIEQTLVWHPVGLEAESVAIEKVEPLRAELDHFFACIDTGQTPLSNGQTALNVARVVEALGNG